MKTTTAVLLFLLLSLPVDAGDEKPGAGKVAPEPLVTEAASGAIDRGLAWLDAAQKEDGSWDAYVGFKRNDDYIREKTEKEGHPGLTAFAALALIATGTVPGEGERGERLDRALDFLVSCRQEDGMISAHGTRMDSHGLALYALATARRLKPDEGRDRCMTAAAVFTVRTQNPEGGWDYAPFSRDGDVIVTSGQLLGLLAARDAGLRVPVAPIDRAVEFVLRCAVVETGPREGWFAYRPVGSRGARCTYAQTAAALNALTHAGVRDGESLLGFVLRTGRPQGPLPRLEVTARGLRGMYDVLPETGYRRFFSIYHAARALHARGDEEFAEMYRQLAENLASRQEEDGSWRTPSVGDVFATSVALIVLSLSRGHLPTIPR